MSKRRRQLPRRSPRKQAKYNFKTLPISDSDTDEDAVEYLGTWKNDNRTRQQKRGRNTQNLNIEPAIIPNIPAPAPRRKRQTNNSTNKRSALVNATSQTDGCEMCSHRPKSPDKLKIVAIKRNTESSEDESSHHPSTSFPAITNAVSSSPRNFIAEKNDAPNSSGSDVSKVSSFHETNNVVATDSACAETANESIDQSSEQAVPEEGESTLSMPNHVVEATITGDHVNGDGLFNLYFADPVGLGDGIHNNILSIPFPLDELYAIDEDDENNSEDE